MKNQQNKSSDSISGYQDIDDLEDKEDKGNNKSTSSIIKLIILIIIISLFAVGIVLLVCFPLKQHNYHPYKNKNPHKVKWLDAEMIKSLETVKRIDQNGFLYEMNFTANYNDKHILKELNDSGKIDFGCSAFTTYNKKNEKLLCRNFDIKHKVNNKSTDVTGLNVFIRCNNPTAKYKSIGIADAIYVYENDTSIRAGALDDGKTDISNLMLLPYEIMDGINEKGLAISILLTDLKKGEKPYKEEKEGCKGVAYSVLMRYILDNCKNIDEAINLTKSYNIIPYKSGKNAHIFLSESTGKSVVFEWRNNNSMKIIETDAVTNFYLGYSDAEDHYNTKGELIEKFSMVTNTYLNYSYGYGHGYYRFNGVVSALQRYKDRNYDYYRTKIDEDVAKGILYQACQDVGTEDTSMTQYSVIYNQDKLNLKVWVRQNFSKLFEFNMN